MVWVGRSTRVRGRSGAGTPVWPRIDVIGYSAADPEWHQPNGQRTSVTPSSTLFHPIHQENRLRLGADLRYWRRFSRAVRDLVRRQAFLPAIFSWTPPPASSRGRKPQAPPGQAADLATTGAGPAAGLAEANPLLASTTALAAATLVKVAAVPALPRHSIGACYRNVAPLSDMGWTAAACNLAAMAGLGRAAIIPTVEPDDPPFRRGRRTG